MTELFLLLLALSALFTVLGLACLAGEKAMKIWRKNADR